MCPSTAGSEVEYDPLIRRPSRAWGRRHLKAAAVVGLRVVPGLFMDVCLIASLAINRLIVFELTTSSLKRMEEIMKKSEPSDPALW